MREKVMSEKGAKVNATVRALRILKAMKGRSLAGVSNKELALNLGESAVNVSRALKVLMAEGFVVKNEMTGRFMLSYQLLAMAREYQIELASQKSKIDAMQYGL